MESKPLYTVKSESPIDRSLRCGLTKNTLYNIISTTFFNILVQYISEFAFVVNYVVYSHYTTHVHLRISKISP